MKNRGVKTTTVIITLTILSLLIIAGPANALALGLNISDPFVNHGNITTFNVSSKIEPNEKILIDKFRVDISGPENISCEFTPNGTLISNCDGINIKVISLIKPENIPSSYDSGGYGYGYSYGYGGEEFSNITLSYAVLFNTLNYKTGIYATDFVLVSNGHEFKKDGASLYVFDQTGLRGCSLRAKSGEVDLKNETISRSQTNKLNIHIPLENSADGQGSLLAQSSKERFTYDFNVLGVLSNDDKNAMILVKGGYKLGRSNTTTSDIAMINIDKKHKELNLAGKSITASNMDVNFLTSACLK